MPEDINNRDITAGLVGKLRHGSGSSIRMSSVDTDSESRFKSKYPMSDDIKNRTITAGLVGKFRHGSGSLAKIVDP